MSTCTKKAIFVDQHGDVVAECPTLLRIVLIGSLPPPFGGTTVLFQQLVTELAQRSDVHLDVLDASRRKGSFGVLDAMLFSVRFAWRLIMALRKSHVATFHASTPGTIRFGPALFALCKIARVPLVLREFGGSLDHEYREMPRISQYAIRTVFRANRVLLETRALTDYFTTEFPWSRFDWYSNSRPMQTDTNTHSTIVHPARCFVYVGHVKVTKGIQEIIEAAEKLGDIDVRIDVYGPIVDGFDEHQFDLNARVTYRGTLPPDQVISTIRQYDAVLLPTYHFGEGYPGIVIEAYAAGRPIIASRWRAIPEIVEHGVSGLLIEPRDAGDLARAMRRLNEDPQLLHKLTKGAQSLAYRFSSRHWTERFVEVCREVVAEQNEQKPRER